MFNRKSILKMTIMVSLSLALSMAGIALAQEVGKGKIPGDQVARSTKTLPWGVKVWDTAEALACLKAGEKALWVDTRPASFFKQGTVRGGVLLIYNVKGAAENTLTKESLNAALSAAGLGSDAKIIFYCQGPKCHRSYNAAFIAVTEWGFAKDRIIWHREGYPFLFKEIKGNAKLKRRAKKYISDDGLNQM